MHRDHVQCMCLQDNVLHGSFLAELTKEVLSDLEASKYQHAEYRISIYGRKRVEWDILAAWIVQNSLCSDNVVWLIQVPPPCLIRCGPAGDELRGMITFAVGGTSAVFILGQKQFTGESGRDGLRYPLDCDFTWRERCRW